MTLPLNGLTVLDLSRLLPGPVCTLHLQDMGARVIKIEDTAAGDYSRTLGMPQGVISPVFHLLNRGKESVSLDLNSSDGRELLLQLVRRADVVVESFRPGVMKKLGLSYDCLKTVNPGIIMCSLSGYGQDGPWADKAGHDMNYCAVSGVLDQCGEAGGQPALTNFQIADLAGGALSAALAIVAALSGRLMAQLRGEEAAGCYLDISMTDCTFANHLIPLAAVNLAGRAFPRGQDMLTGGRPNYSVYATSDQRYMAVAALEKKFWDRTCAVLQKPQWQSLYTVTGSAAEQLRQDISELFLSRPQHEWRELFAEEDCCVTAVLSPQEAFTHPQLLAREMVRELKTAGMTLQCPAPAFSFNGEKAVISNAGPLQGEHTRPVLLALGISEQQIQQWQEQGIVRHSRVNKVSTATSL